MTCRAAGPTAPAAGVATPVRSWSCSAGARLRNPRAGSFLRRACCATRLASGEEGRRRRLSLMQASAKGMRSTLSSVGSSAHAVAQEWSPREAACWLQVCAKPGCRHTQTHALHAVLHGRLCVSAGDRCKSVRSHVQAGEGTEVTRVACTPRCPAWALLDTLTPSRWAPPLGRARRCSAGGQPCSGWNRRPPMGRVRTRLRKALLGQPVLRLWHPAHIVDGGRQRHGCRLCAHLLRSALSRMTADSVTAVVSAHKS